MGKRRHTAKTGDKSLYKKAAEARAEAAAAAKASKRRGNDDDDNGDDTMYNSVDKYHNQLDKNFLKFDVDPTNESDEEEEVEAVLDLGVGGDSSEADDDSDEDSEDDAENPRLAREDLSSSSSDEDDQDIEDVRDWGKKKSAYYHGDTADLELGQDEDDAFLEEEAAKEVQAARYKEMDEADFMLSEEEEEEKKEPKKKPIDKEDGKKRISSSIQNIAKLATKDRRKLIEKQHPGLLQITSHFAEIVQTWKNRTSLAAKALFEEGDQATAEAVGATKMGQKYLLARALIESSTALNLAMFLLLKSEESSRADYSLGDFASSVPFHPVMKRLQEFNVLGQKLKAKVEEQVDGLGEQMDSLVKAAELMKSLAPEDDEEEEHESVGGENGNIGKETGGEAMTSDVAQLIASSSSSDDESSMDDEALSRSAVHDAKFGLRPSEMEVDAAPQRRLRRPAPSDLGDDGDAEDDRLGASRYLSSTINSIQQRAAIRKRTTLESAELEQLREPEPKSRSGWAMMEEELEKPSDEGGDDAAVDDNDVGKDGGGGDNAFYDEMVEKSKRKREFKKSLYQVAPKFPRIEAEIEGERAISRTIMKNRGLVAHKNKLNRNPRVKKREQYRKALIRRKGAVREVRTDEGHRYGGELTGIKKGISRSRKLSKK